ncbi:MAG: hypothetical protein OXQ28_11800 [Acidobacteriota bacterium]|nr:hypothetical protein [Acidobacteriota bacterium]
MNDKTRLQTAFEDIAVHKASFVTVGARVLVVRTLGPGETVDRSDRDAFRVIAQRGFDVLIVRVDGERSAISAQIAPAYRALDAPEAFDRISTASAIHEWIRDWLAKARRIEETGRRQAAAAAIKAKQDKSRKQGTR